MEDSPYVANYNYALSYLKLGQKEAAIEALKRALAQVPEDEKNKDKPVYLSILSVLAFLVIEKNDFESVAGYVEEGLAIKSNHADLLFMKSLLLMDMKKFDEMLEALVHCLLALDEKNNEMFDYKYAGEGTLKEVYENLLPMACKYAFELDKIKDITRRLWQASQSEKLRKAYDIMDGIARSRDDKEH